MQNQVEIQKTEEIKVITKTTKVIEFISIMCIIMLNINGLNNSKHVNFKNQVHAKNAI